MSEKKMMLGNAAIARGVWEAGVKVSSAYPGTPSTEISEELVKYPGVYAEWAPNEKVATEVAIGASISGVRSFCTMKMVGLNVAADPLYSFSYIGCNGGLVAVVADDPGLYSSQNEQDTRMVCRAAAIPCMEPADSQEAKDYIKYAYEISEKFDTPVIVRTTTRLAHSQCEVELCDREEIADKPYERNIQKNVMMPAMAKKRHVVVEQRMKDLAEYANTAPFNTVEMGDMEIDGKKIGFITEGIAYQYVKEVCPNASILKLGMCHPLPEKLIKDFASKVDVLYIFEELEPVVEEQVKAWGIPCIGKERFTIQGEYSANMIREKVLGMDLGIKAAPQIPPRPPILCPGCPHRATFSVLNKLKIHAAGDIGCYTLGALAPLSVVDTTVCMGSSISSLHGMEKAKGHDYIKNWVAVIGDSTFMHTGINSLINIEIVPAVDFKNLCNGIGITNVHVVNPFDLDALTKVIKEEVKKEELSVIVAKAPCALLKDQKHPYKVEPIPDKCVHCGACLRPGCPALTKNEDGTISIDRTMCNGCGLCMSLCKVGALQQVKA